MTERKPTLVDMPSNITPNATDVPRHYAPPTLEKMQKLSDVTGLPFFSGIF